MSVNPLKQACDTAILNLASLVRTDQTVDNDEPKGTIESLISRDNASSTGTIIELLNPPKTKNGEITKREARIFYRPRLCPDVMDDWDNIDNEFDACSPGNRLTLEEDNLVLEDYTARPLEFDPLDWQHLCKPRTNYAGGIGGSPTSFQFEMLEQFMQVEKEIINVLNRKANIKLQAKVGKFKDGSTSKTIDLLNGNGWENKGIMNAAGLAAFIAEFRKLNLKGKPIAIGAGNLWSAIEATGFQANDRQGVNMGRFANSAMNYYYDVHQGLVGGFDNNTVIAYAPGVVRPLFANRHLGNENMTPMTRLYQGFYPSRLLPGVVFDLTVLYPDCKGPVTVALGTLMDLYVGPDIACQSTSGVNGILKFDITKYTPTP